MITVHFQGKIFKITIIQVYALTSNAEEAEVEQFYKNLQDLRTNTPTRYHLHYRGLECKIRNSRNTWSNRNIWPWKTEWNRTNSNRVFPRKRTGHNKYPFSATQEMTLCMDITKRTMLKSDWLYSLQPNKKKLYTSSKNKTGSWLWLRSWTPYCQIQT